MKKKLNKQMLLLVVILLLLSTVVYAQNEENKIVMTEKSEIFSQWENLSTEQKEQTIEPLFFNINVKDSMKRSIYNELTDIKVGTGLGSRYNLKEHLNEIKVENQRKTGSCWAFSFTTALETTLSNKYNKTSAQYSPMHMEYLTSKMYNRILGNGGSAMMAVSYGVSNRGPIYESELPFESVYNEETNSEENYYLKDIENVTINQKAKARVKDAVIFAPICKSYETNSITYKDGNGNDYSDNDVLVLRNAIKKHIKENGAIFAYLYSDIGRTTEGNYVSVSGSYNPLKKAYYYKPTTNTNISPNHAVTIVGWDDTFSKGNFSAGKQPLNDGAYIVLNSYGEGFGENGYFYVSYDDLTIERGLVGIKDASEEDGEQTYDNLYEYDELGMSTALWSVAMNNGEPEYYSNGYGANVFTRKDTKEIEYLSEVGIFLKSAQGVEIYVNEEDADLNDCELVGTYTGTNALESGYHSLKLASPVKLTGSKFVVKVKYINSPKASIPVECDLFETGISKESTAYDKATSNRGESFYSTTGETWQDLYNLELLPGVVIKNTNVCIKAFTTVSKVISTQGVELNKNTTKIEVGDTETLQANVLPENATNKNIRWTSTNNNIATVINGEITGISEGTATITVTTEDGGHTDTCVVTVEKKNIPATGVNLDKANLSIKVGVQANLVATVQPTNATNKNITWTSSNNNIATVLNGKITGIAEGTATITVSTQDGNYTDTCVVTVEKEPEPDKTIAVTGVKLDKTTLAIKVGDETNLVATVQPTDATNKNIKWTSSNANVATVVAGKVTGISEGTATITVTTDDGGYTDTCVVAVEKKTISVTGVDLDKSKLSIKVGAQVNLVATVKPTNATNKNVKWTSSNNNVVTVLNGTITGVSEGTATITVTTDDGNYKDTCIVTVEKEPEQDNTIHVTGVKLNKTTLSMQVGDEANLVATIQPTNATNKNVKWTSSNENVATITENGIIEALNEGKTNITVTTEDGKFNDTCQITVVKRTNTDDDIYIDKEEKPGKVEQVQNQDTSVAQQELPKAGIKTIIILVVSISIIAIVIYIRYNKYKDIK